MGKLRKTELVAHTFILELLNQLLGQTGLSGSDEHTFKGVLVILGCDLTHKPFLKHHFRLWTCPTSYFKPNINTI